ncbi:MAG: DUF4268 domain-containing protein [Alphaproteobacteria bacterium GM7ARS4]|nr:DUF4268 domain-containing protein [Alphaproteobacteria bacterium GM7ARS4]
MDAQHLKNFKRVKDLRAIWPGGREDFLAWLKKDENFHALGDCLSMDLKLLDDDSLKKNLGADVLGKARDDKGHDHIVMIQVRLEDSSDSDVGTILTNVVNVDVPYLTVVWVATPFAERHKKTLNWLNSKTDESITFCGVDPGIWTIGDSDPAIWFDVVSSSPHFHKSASTPSPAKEEGKKDNVSSGVKADNVVLPKDMGREAVAGVVASSPLPRDALIKKYWVAFRAFMEQQGSKIGLPEPSSNEWTSYSIGCHNFYLMAVIKFANKKELPDSSISVVLLCQGPSASKNFNLLLKHKEKVEWEIGVNLEWRELRREPQSHDIAHVMLAKNTDPSDESIWPQQHKWLLETLEKFDTAFRPRTKMIDSLEKFSPDTPSSFKEGMS